MIKNKEILKKGFTLIELVVVIVILSILALVIVPNMSFYKRDASIKKIQAEMEGVHIAVESIIEETINMDNLFDEENKATAPLAYHLEKVTDLGFDTLSDYTFTMDDMGRLMLTFVKDGETYVYNGDPQTRLKATTTIPDSISVDQYYKENPRVLLTPGPGVFIVEFLSGEIVQKVEHVKAGESATAPLIAPRQGYKFKGWDKDFSEINEDEKVYAVWERLYTPTASNPENLYSYEDREEGVAVVGFNQAYLDTYTGGIQPTKAVIPGKSNENDPVVAIGKGAFVFNSLTSVEIPNSVITVEEGAFYKNRLSSVYIPNSVETIGIEAFMGNNLSKIDIPNTVKTIEKSAFKDNLLTEISFEDNSQLKTIGNLAFGGNKLKSAILPSSVTTIESAAFNDNQMSDGLAFIYARKSDGREDKTNLVSYGGSKRSNVVIPNNIKTIASEAFKENNITSISFEEDSQLLAIGEKAFYDNLLTSLSLPASVTAIARKAFKNNQITTLTIGDSLSFVGDQAFSWGAREPSIKDFQPTGPWTGTWTTSDGSVWVSN